MGTPIKSLVVEDIAKRAEVGSPRLKLWRGLQAAFHPITEPALVFPYWWHNLGFFFSPPLRAHGKRWGLVGQPRATDPQGSSKTMIFSYGFGHGPCSSPVYAQGV
jgi:hypothetical protein